MRQKWSSLGKLKSEIILNFQQLRLSLCSFGERTHLFQPTLYSWSFGGASRSQLKYRLCSSGSLLYRHPSSQRGATHGARVVQVSHVLFTALSLSLATPPSPVFLLFLWTSPL